MAFKLQTAVNIPEEGIQHPEHSGSLKSRITYNATIHSANICSPLRQENIKLRQKE
jgi:hypothetical protein